MTLDCMYSCNLCGIEKAHVQVPILEESQSVLDWLDNTATPAIEVIIADHSRRSPNCFSNTFSEVVIGGPSIQ